MNKAPQVIPTQPRDVIFAQLVPLGVRRSAWLLYQHEIDRIDPATGKNYRPRKALRNVLAWIDEQRLLLELIKQRPTPTQLRLLQMMVDGMTQKEIAFVLGKNVATTKLHFSHLRERLGVGTLYQAIAIATKRGWVRVSPGRKDSN